MRRVFLATAILWAVLAPAGADESDVLQGQSVIAGQIDAFRSGDNERAYSYAAPNIKAIFPSVDRFMGMVANGYKPVQMPQSYSFGRSRELGDGRIIAQEVLLVGPDGKDYVALYELLRMQDGSLKIMSVQLVPGKAQTT